MDRSRNVLLFASGGLVLVALIVNAALKFHNVQLLIENDRLVAHTHQVKEHLNVLLTTFVDTETAVRGYVIAGEKEFLQPYNEAQARVDQEFQQLGQLVTDSPTQQNRVVQLQDLRDRHQRVMTETLDVFREKGAMAAREVVRSGRGKRLMDKIRAEIATMVADEDRLLTERTQVAKQRYRTAITTGAIGTALSLTMTAVALVIFWAELQRRRAAETALKSQTEEVRLSAERFRLLTETAPIHIWISDPSGMALFLNKNWQDYTGLSANADGVANWMSAIHPVDVEKVQAVWNSEGASKDLYLDEVRVFRQEDQTYRWHRCAIVPVRTRHGKLQSWVGTLTDIQDQKDQAKALENMVLSRTRELRLANDALREEVQERTRAEEQVSAVAAELRRSNEELEKFAYVASHDLQEPLRKIQAFGDRLYRKSRDHLDEQSQGYLDRMLASATRMRTLIDDLLTFSRVSSTSRALVPVDLNVTLAEVLADLETTLAQAQARVEATPLPTIEADPMQMRQLFQNLIGNAVKFTKPGEPPVLKIQANPLATLPANADPVPQTFAGWRLTFADHGIGFEQNHEKRIFELFQRLHGRDQYSGTGIGLAICKKIVERHGGVVHARAQLGDGATFIIDLPEAAAAVIEPRAELAKIAECA